MRGLVSRRGCLPSAESGRPVARFDEVVDQSGHVIPGTWCPVAEPRSKSIAETITAAFSYEANNVLRRSGSAMQVLLGHTVPERPAPVSEHTE